MRCLRRTNQVQNTKTFHNNTKNTVEKNCRSTGWSTTCKILYKLALTHAQSRKLA